MPGILTGPGISSIGSNQELADFSNVLAGATGLDPRVIYAWGMEETGGAPYGGHHNWLNLRPYPGDPYSGVSPGNFEEYNSIGDAERAAIIRLHQPFARGIIASAGSTPANEISAIAASGWDAGHYGGPGGPNLLSEFRSIYPNVATGGAALSPGTKITGATGGGVAPKGVVSGIESAVTGPFKAVEGYIVKGLLIILGSGIALIGLYFIVRALGGPSVGIMDKATSIATRGAVSAAPPRQGDAAIERGEPVARTDAPRTPTRSDKRQAARNARGRERAAQDAKAGRDARYGGDDDIPF